MTYAERAERLRALARGAELQAVALVPGPNLAYVTGLRFHLSERPVLGFFPVEGRPVLVVPRLERTKAERAPYPCEIVTYEDASGPRSAMRAALVALALDGAWVGVEGRRMRFLELDLMARTEAGPRVFDAQELFTELRIRKSLEEVAAMRQAVTVAETAIAQVLGLLRPGMTEREAASALVARLIGAGSDPELPFSPIVAAGENGALPHATPTDRTLRPGDVVTIDWGAAHDGYISDITRNYAVGGPVPPELARAHDVVRAANEAGRAAVRPGASGHEVDRACRRVIEDAGLGALFPHRTGHGIGLEGHEEPQAKEGAHRPLEPGMTFTVEPGVYLPGVGGVRIEDDVLVTANGCETLTTLERELVSLG